MSIHLFLREINIWKERRIKKLPKKRLRRETTKIDEIIKKWKKIQSNIYIELEYFFRLKYFLRS